MLSRRAFLALVGGGAGAAGLAALAFRVLPDGGSVSAFPEIRFGQELCSYCGMSIDDPRFASAWRASSGERHFDDIGCMVNAYRRDHPAGDIRFFVHDYTSKAWLDAADASFVVSSTVKTPMAYGVYAVAHDAPGGARAPGDAVAYIEWGGLLASLERRS